MNVIPIHFQKKANRLRHAGQSEQRERRSGIQRNCQKAQPFDFIFFKKTKNKTLRVLAYVLDSGSALTAFAGPE
jgi:hypothetical protein